MTAGAVFLPYRKTVKREAGENPERSRHCKGGVSSLLSRSLIGSGLNPLRDSWEGKD